MADQELEDLIKRAEQKFLAESGEYSASPTETYVHSLAPNAVTSRLYGAIEAVKAPWGKKMETYDREMLRGKEYLEKSQEENPTAALAGNATTASIGLLGGGAAVAPKLFPAATESVATGILDSAGNPITKEVVKRSSGSAVKVAKKLFGVGGRRFADKVVGPLGLLGLKEGWDLIRGK